MKNYYGTIFKVTFQISIAILITSCSFLSPVKVAPTKTYLLNAMPQSFPYRHPRPVTLLVNLPETRPAFDTKQMAYTIQPYQIAYFAENEWAETPSQMLQVSLLQTLRNTHHFRTVAIPPYLGHYNYVVNSQILMIEQDFIRSPVMKIVINVQILNAANQLAATKQFSVGIPMQQAAPYAGVVAANEGMAILLREIAMFCIEKTRYH